MNDLTSIEFTFHFTPFKWELVCGSQCHKDFFYFEVKLGPAAISVSWLRDCEAANG